MTVKLLRKHYLEIISLKGGCTGSSESTLVKIPHCWKSHGVAHICIVICTVCFTYVTHEHAFLHVNKVFIYIYYFNINQKECNLAVLLINSHVLWQGRIQKISYWGVGCGEWGGRGLSLTDILVFLYLLFTECSN